MNRKKILSTGINKSPLTQSAPNNFYLLNLPPQLLVLFCLMLCISAIDATSSNNWFESDKDVLLSKSAEIDIHRYDPTGQTVFFGTWHGPHQSDQIRELLNALCPESTDPCLVLLEGLDVGMQFFSEEQKIRALSYPKLHKSSFFPDIKQISVPQQWEAILPVNVPHHILVSSWDIIESYPYLHTEQIIQDMSEEINLSTASAIREHLLRHRELEDCSHARNTQMLDITSKARLQYPDFNIIVTGGISHYRSDPRLSESFDSIILTENENLHSNQRELDKAATQLHVDMTPDERRCTPSFSDEL